MIENSQYLDVEIINDLLEMLGDGVNEIMLEFQTTALDQINSARQAAEGNKIENLMTIVHSLKGAAGNIGLQKVYESCRELECNLRNNIEVDVVASMETIQKEYFLTISELKVLRLI